MLIYIILVSIAAILIISLISILLFACYTCLNTCKKPKDPISEIFEETYRVKYMTDKEREALESAFDRFPTYKAEETSILSHDGLNLFGHIIEPKISNPNGTVILVHGYRSSCRHDLCMQVSFLLEEGYRVLCVDQRAHGKSEGKYITFGVLERLDVKAWCDHACKLFGESSPIALFGASMGGTTVVCSTETGLPKNVRAVICDGGYTSPWNVHLHRFRQKHSISPFPLMHIEDLFSKLIAKFSLKDISSPRAVSSSNLPFLLIYGTADKAVPYEMGVAISKTSERTKLISVEGAHHLCCCIQEPARYKNEVISFLEKNMK